MNKKATTIDDLARMVQEGFTESKSQMDEQFARVDKQFARVDEQFAQVDKQFTQVHRELHAIRKDLLGVVYRPEFEGLQDRVKDLENLFTSLKKKAA